MTAATAAQRRARRDAGVPSRPGAWRDRRPAGGRETEQARGDLDGHASGKGRAGTATNSAHRPYSGVPEGVSQDTRGVRPPSWQPRTRGGELRWRMRYAPHHAVARRTDPCRASHAPKAGCGANKPTRPVMKTSGRVNRQDESQRLARRATAHRGTRQVAPGPERCDLVLADSAAQSRRHRLEDVQGKTRVPPSPQEVLVCWTAIVRRPGQSRRDPHVGLDGRQDHRRRQVRRRPGLGAVASRNAVSASRWSGARTASRSPA